MGAAIQLFEGFYTDQSCAPDTVNNIDTFDVNDIEKGFVVSRKFDGQILSTYQDNIWNFKPYCTSPSQYGVINFNTRISPKHINEAKKLVFLLLVFGNGRNGSQPSVKTLLHYFDGVVKPLADFALQNEATIAKVIENHNLLINYINSKCKNLGMVQSLLTLLTFLDKLDNRITQINFQRNKDIFELLRLKSNKLSDQRYQTSLIPSRILAESIRQRWRQIDEIEKNLINLMKFFSKYIESERFACGKGVNLNSKEALKWGDAVNFYQLNNLFTKFGVNNRINFKGFLTKIQGTCKQLLHAYTGMRNGEVLNIQTNCLEKISTESGVCRIISTTSKFAGTNKKAKWITSKEIERVIHILSSINKVIADRHGLEIHTLPLFIGSEFFFKKYKIKTNERSIESKTQFKRKDELPLDYSKLCLSLDDKQEVEEIDFNRNIRDLKIGQPWEFESHQYRRSLAVYSIQSGLVSLGALQIQFKHLFREMTLYYSNGASYARKLFDVPKKHIANELDALKPELDTLAYIKNVIFSDEKLFGAHGHFVEKQNQQNNQEFNTYFLENRDKTLKQFKNGEIAYKETALGGCIATEACDSMLTRSITACFDCYGGVLKKSKVENVIQKQREFIACLDPFSIEYRTEIEDLNKLEELSSKLIKENTNE